VLLNSTVKTIAYSSSGVEVVLTNGSSFHGEHAIVTFSLGVLQNRDVLFKPPLPAWKMEGIYSMKMVCIAVLIQSDILGFSDSKEQATFTKIFLRFPYKFWFDTEVSLRER
jgi:polyamine oxidase